jgi:hypothetical protein
MLVVGGVKEGKQASSIMREYALFSLSSPASSGPSPNPKLSLILTILVRQN